MRLINVGKRAKIGDESVGGGGEVYFDFCRRWELTRKITITSGGHEFVSYDNKFGVGTNGDSLSVGQCEREGFDVTFRIKDGIYSRCLEMTEFANIVSMFHEVEQLLV